MNVLCPCSRVFNHAPEGKEVSERLLEVKQGNHRMVEYRLDFRTLAAESGWNKTALKAIFHQGLNREVLCSVSVVFECLNEKKRE